MKGQERNSKRSLLKKALFDLPHNLGAGKTIRGLKATKHLKADTLLALEKGVRPSASLKLSLTRNK